MQLWKDTSLDPEFAKKVFYHGAYTEEEIERSAVELKETGRSLFFGSKGLTTKELMALGQNVITTLEGNDDVAPSGVASLSEARLADDVLYRQGVLGQIVGFLSQENSVVEACGESGRNYIAEQFGIQKWGKRLTIHLVVCVRSGKECRLLA